MPYSRYDLLIQRSKSTDDSTRCGLRPTTRGPLKRLGPRIHSQNLLIPHTSLPQQTFTLTYSHGRA
eukprot:527390-Pyramimonas_sp.AAC.1